MQITICVQSCAPWYQSPSVSNLIDRTCVYSTVWAGMGGVVGECSLPKAEFGYCISDKKQFSTFGLTFWSLEIARYTRSKLTVTGYIEAGL